MAIEIIAAGESRSFPDGTISLGEGEGRILIGNRAGSRYAELTADAGGFVALELGTECLANHVGLTASDVHLRTVGFARFRMGEAAPSPLVELVRMPWTDPAAVAAAPSAF